MQTIFQIYIHTYNTYIHTYLFIIQGSLISQAPKKKSQRSNLPQALQDDSIDPYEMLGFAIQADVAS